MIEILYVSQDGQTEKIASYIFQKLAKRHVDVRLTNITNQPNYSLDSSVSHVLLGVPIRYGKPMPQAKAWLDLHSDSLRNCLLSAFTVNLTARKPEKSTVETCPYTKKLVAILPKPADNLAIFAGALDYQRYSWFDRNMIKFIMWMTSGPTRSRQRIEYTQWQQVDSFVESLINRNHL